MRKSLFYLFCFIAIQFVCCWLVYLVWYLVDGMPLGQVLRLFGSGQIQPSTDMMIVGTAFFGLVTVLVFTLKKWSPVSRDYLRSHPWVTLFWCVLATCGTIIPSVWLQEQLPELPNFLPTTFDGLLSRPLGYIFVGIIAPFVEELVFRGAILRVLLGKFRSAWLAIFISAALFSISHGNPAQMPHAFLLGLLIGWLYKRTGSIVPGVVLHWTNNTIAYVIFNLYPAANDMRLIDIFRGSQLHVWLSLLFSLFIFLPSIYQIYVRTGKLKVLAQASE